MLISFFVKRMKARRLLQKIKKLKREIETVIGSKHFNDYEKSQFVILSNEEIKKLEARINVTGYGLTGIRKKP